MVVGAPESIPCSSDRLSFRLSDDSRVTLSSPILQIFLEIRIVEKLAELRSAVVWIPEKSFKKHLVEKVEVIDLSWSNGNVIVGCHGKRQARCSLCLTTEPNEYR